MTILTLTTLTALASVLCTPVTKIPPYSHEQEGTAGKYDLSVKTCGIQRCSHHFSPKKEWRASQLAIHKCDTY